MGNIKKSSYCLLCDVLRLSLFCFLFLFLGGQHELRGAVGRSGAGDHEGAV